MVSLLSWLLFLGIYFLFICSQQNQNFKYLVISCFLIYFVDHQRCQLVLIIGVFIISNLLGLVLLRFVNFRLGVDHYCYFSCNAGLGPVAAGVFSRFHLSQCLSLAFIRLFSTSFCYMYMFMYNFTYIPTSYSAGLLFYS